MLSRSYGLYLRKTSCFGLIIEKVELKPLGTCKTCFQVHVEKWQHKDGRAMKLAEQSPMKTQSFGLSNHHQQKNFSTLQQKPVNSTAAFKGLTCSAAPWSGVAGATGKSWTGVLTCTVRLVSRKSYVFPELRSEDLEEAHVRGSGPGGQSVNQTANCVVLKHKPTGVVVKCHETRSLERNRERARERLQEKLDLHLNGDSSFLARQKREESAERKRKKKNAQERLAVKKAFKEREGLD